jgi:phage shock protein PspC (stress-responsive transcriptional regulator)
MNSTTAPNPHENSLAGARAWFAENNLTRPRAGRLVGGVSAGFARRFSVNMLVARVATVGIAIVLTPLVYIPFWVLMPEDA